jgi:hypothetical protein
MDFTPLHFDVCRDEAKSDQHAERKQNQKRPAFQMTLLRIIFLSAIKPFSLGETIVITRAYVFSGESMLRI